MTPTPNSGQIVQTLPAQVATSQVVSVSQLTGVGTVFTTSGIPSNATTSSLRAQRIVTAPGIQEIQFSPRSGTQPTAVVSVSGLTGQNVTSTQIQASQLRLSMGANQQVSGVVTKGGIPMIGAITATGKPITQPTQFQIVRQNPSRQQFKVLNTAQGNTVLQTVGGQVSVVNQSGAIIQGGIVATGTNVGQTIQLQPSSGQKVSLATVSGVTGSPGLATNVASVATVQVNSANTTTSQRTHFMVQQRQQGNTLYSLDCWQFFDFSNEFLLWFEIYSKTANGKSIASKSRYNSSAARSIAATITIATATSQNANLTTVYAKHSVAIDQRHRTTAIW